MKQRVLNDRGLGMLRMGIIGMSALTLMMSMSQAVSARSQSFKKFDRVTLVASPKHMKLKEEDYREPSPAWFKPSVNPTARIIRLPGRPSVSPFDVFQSPIDPRFADNCFVDFSDYDALDLLEFSFIPFAENTFTYSPWWFQACDGLNHVVIRPIGYDHFHLNYEDPHIGPCPGGFVDYGILQEDGTCKEIDPREEPRSLSPHDWYVATHLYVWDGLQQQPFQLNKIRVENQEAIRLCYKPLQDDEGPWETSEPDGTTSPGIWFCWEHLPTGYWDVSDWTGSITDVKIQASHVGGIYQIDDLEIEIY